MHQNERKTLLAIFRVALIVTNLSNFLILTIEIIFSDFPFIVKVKTIPKNN